MKNPQKPKPVSEHQRPLSPNTTAQEDLTKEGQRAINLIWEHTQATIAKSVVLTTLFVNSALSIGVVFFNIELTIDQVAFVGICLQPLILTTGIVIGFYYARTNHAAIGGVGRKPEQHEYTGR